MATSSTGGGGDYFAEGAVNSAAIEQNMARAAQSIDLAAKNLSTFSAETIKIKKDFQDIGSQAILNPELLSTSKEFEEAALRIVTQYGKINKHAGSIVKLNKQIKKQEQDIATGKGKQTTESKKLLNNMKKIVTEYDKGVKSQTKQGSAWKDNVKKAQRFASTVTGLNISFMGLVAMIMDVANLTRKINAYAQAGAAHLGDGAKAVYQTKSAMFDLRRSFAVSYEEAGKIVGQLEAMGFTGEQIARKGPMLRSLRKENKELIKNMANYENILGDLEDGSMELKKGETILSATNRLYTEAEKVNTQIVKDKKLINDKEKEIAEHNKKAREAAKHQVSTAQELYAIQRKYGIDIGKTGGIIKTLQQDFSASNEQARGLLGTAITLGTSLKSGGMRIGISDLLKDWGQLIENTKVYKTDLLGILGLYNVMMKEDLASKLGLGGVAKSVKMDIAKTLTSSALNMEFGWKARLGMRAGLGTSPAAAGIGFEKLLQGEAGKGGPLTAFKTIVAEVTSMVGDIKKHPFVAEFKGRQLFQGLGFSKESSVALARSVAKGNLTEDSVKKTIEAQMAEDKKMHKLEREWNKHRVDLVTKAGNIATNQMNYQEELRKWVEDKLMKPLLSIYATLQAIYAWFAGGSAAADLGYQQFGNDVKAGLGLKGPVAGKSLASQAFPIFTAHGLGGKESARIDLAREKMQIALRSGSQEERKKATNDFFEEQEKYQVRLFNSLLKTARGRIKSGQLKNLKNLIEDANYSEAANQIVKILGKEYVSAKVANQQRGQIEQKARTRYAHPGKV